SPSALRAATIVSQDAYSLTEYDFRDPVTAWRDLNIAIASHLDFASAIIAGKLLSSSLQSYGADDPQAFLAAVGPQISTVRMNPESKALLVVDVLDAQTLRKLMLARLGSKSKAETFGDAELSISTDRPEEAISLVGNTLLIGSPEVIRQCLQARLESKTLANSDHFRRAMVRIDPAAQATAITLTNDQEPARSFIHLFSSNRTLVSPGQNERLNNAMKQLPYAVKVTRMTEDGFEQTSRSSF